MNDRIGIGEWKEDNDEDDLSGHPLEGIKLCLQALDMMEKAYEDLDYPRAMRIMASSISTFSMLPASILSEYMREEARKKE
jgi:hypothetical protein